MMRTSIFATAILSLVLSVGCDKAADEQQKANAAQTEANEKIISARNEADKKVVGAQVEADKKIAEAQAGFLKMREDYRHKTTVALTDLDKNIEVLEGKAKTATGKAKADLDANLKQIRTNRDAFVADYKSIEGSSATTWDSTKVRLDKEWTDLKALVDKN